MAQQIDRIREIVERVADDSGLEVVEVELRGAGKARMLRITIDKPEGVTHEDCANVSREVGTILDVEDTVPGGSYTLEVSSPGLDRKLLKPTDYERFAGSLVKVLVREPVEEQKHFEGRLESLNNGRITLEVPAKKKDPPRKVEIDLANVEKANLVPEL
ncbi:MAG TPA: ribosome maturation factor RimP [Terriglobales bacterium]|nr:ribosome maturation factor RimP [Terriglobales bacterium]